MLPWMDQMSGIDQMLNLLPPLSSSSYTCREGPDKAIIDGGRIGPFRIENGVKITFYLDEFSRTKQPLRL